MRSRWCIILIVFVAALFCSGCGPRAGGFRPSDKRVTQPEPINKNQDTHKDSVPSASQPN